MSVEVYLPVAVQINEDGTLDGAYIDFDGAPWMYVDSEDNVWGAVEDEWTRDSDLESLAIRLLNERLA